MLERANISTTTTAAANTTKTTNISSKFGTSSLLAAMEVMHLKGCAFRIRECGCELLSMEDYLIEDDEETWELAGRDLRLKSTFLFYDLNQLISKAGADHKRTLTELSNRLFYYLEELGDAVKNRSMTTIHVCYDDTAQALQEVMAAVTPAH